MRVVLSTLFAAACASGLALSVITEATPPQTPSPSSSSKMDDDYECSSLTNAINTPKEYNQALRCAARPGNQCRNYTMSSSLYGEFTFAAPNPTAPKYVDIRGTDLSDNGTGVFIAWLTPANDPVYGVVDALSNPVLGCCGADVSSLHACACKLSVSAGLLGDELDFSSLDHVGQLVIDVTEEQQSNVVAPTFRNLVENVYPNLRKEMNLTQCPSDALESVATKLMKDAENKNSTNFDPELCPDDDCVAKVEGKDQYKVPNSRFLHHKGACDDPLVIRSILFRFFDADKQFLGLGYGPFGQKEFFLQPNMLTSTFENDWMTLGSNIDGTDHFCLKSGALSGPYLTKIFCQNKGKSWDFATGTCQ